MFLTVFWISGRRDTTRVYPSMEIAIKIVQHRVEDDCQPVGLHWVSRRGGGRNYQEA